MKKKVLIIIIISMILLNLTPLAYGEKIHLKDIDNHWAKDNILQLIDMGVVNGNPDGTFLPNESISRSAFVKMLITALGVNIVEGNTFSDTESHWSSKYISTGLEMGIILKNEYGESFEPDKNITRAEMARMIARALGDDTTVKEDVSFTDDNKINDGFKKYILLASTKGIITGFPDGSFGPNKDATRAQASVMIVRTINAIKDSKPKKEILEPEVIYSKTSPAVFYIETYDEKGEPLSSGSGFIVNEKGKSITNFHVIDGAYSAKAFLSDGRELDIPKIINYHENGDIAILQLDGDNFPYINLGDSEDIVNGQKIYAIGSPRGLENTISDGLISSRERVLYGEKFIQITAPISPGSSGGALLNSYGEVIGITSFYYRDSQNINFAIPINTAKLLLKDDTNITNFENINKKITLSDINGEVLSVKFYEAGDDYVEKEDRVYSERFPISETRYISWEISLRHEELDKHKDIEITAVHYYSDGSLDGEYDTSFCIEEGLATSRHTGGWGYSDNGLWQSGEYKVEFYMGEELIAQKSFEIYDDLDDISQVDLEVSDLKFFEGKTNYTSDDEKNYGIKFKQSEARFVFWEVYLEHLPPNNNINFDIRTIYRDGEGNKIGDFTENFTIEEGSISSFHSFGVGWEVAGNWDPGTYKVELYIGDNKLTQGYFEIYK